MLDKIQNIVKACNGNEKHLNFLERQLKAYPDYVRSVVNMESVIPILRATKDGDEFRQKVQELDSTRKVYHDAAISACTSINRLCEILKVEPFFEGDVSDRHQVANFAGRFVDELYYKGINRGKDAIEAYIENRENIGPLPPISSWDER
jgi:hypothetical protein